MNRKLFCLLLLIIFSSCTTVHFEPPKGVKYLVSAIPGQEAVCIVDDQRDELPAEIKPISECDNVMGVKPEFYDQLDQWMQDKLTRLEICITVPKKCQ